MGGRRASACLEPLPRALGPRSGLPSTTEMRSHPVRVSIKTDRRERLEGDKLNHYSTTNSRKPLDPAGHHRIATRSAPNRIHAGQGLFPQVVAGVGFEPT